MILARFGVAAVAVACTLAACADGSDGESAVGEPTVLATTSIWADIASQVFCGEAVGGVVPVGADPHTFEPSLRDRERLGNAELIVANGAGLEGSLSDLLDTVAAEGVAVVEMTPHIDVIAADPHVWQDPTRVAGALDVIASAGTPFGLDDCSAGFGAELAALDAEITELLADIPPTRRILVTSHDALAYFADRYDLEVIGTVIPSTNTLAQTNAADLADLADLIEARGVPAIFTEALESTADADALAERLGVAVVPLVTDALTDDPETDTYVEMMRSNATKIAEALTP